MRRNGMNMCEGPLLKKIIVYTIPIILTGILQLLFNAADLIVVGRFCGSLSVGAIGATGSLINLIINFFMGFSVGTGVAVAQGLGADDRKSVFKTVHTAIPVAAIGGAILMIIGLFGSEFFLGLMGTPDNVINLSSLYLKIYFCGLIPSMIFNFGAAILRATGDTKGPLIYLTVAGVANVILNLFFVLFLNMNVAGVALATAISQMISAVLIIIALMRREDVCRLDLKSLQFDISSFSKIVRIGVPAGIQSSLFAISNVLIQSSINSFGEIAMSGNAAAGNIEGFVYTAMNSFSQTAVNFVGQNAGAKKFKRIGKVVVICLLLVAIVGFVLGFAAWFFGRTLLGIYITDSAEAIEYGIIRMSYVALFYFLCGMMDVMTGAMRGLGVSFIPMIITVLGACGFRILWIYTIFETHHTLECLYLSYPVSWMLTGFAQLIAYFFVIHKKKQQLSKL